MIKIILILEVANFLCNMLNYIERIQEDED